MKSITSLAVFLLLAHVQAAPPASVAVGTLVTVSGNISVIDADTGSITLESNNICFVTANSVLTVNGKRGTISDLARGMKVTASAEVAAAEARNEPQKKIVRRLTATGDAAAARPGTISSVLPTRRPPRAPALSREEADAFKKKLSGTFWNVTGAHIRSASGTAWLYLNADGTTTSSGSERAGSWLVFGGGLTVRIGRGVEGGFETNMVMFNAEVNQGTDQRAIYEEAAPGSGVIASPDRVTYTLIPSPAPEMLAKVQQRPLPPTFSSLTSPAVIPAVTPPVVETQQAASDVIKAHNNNLVFVTGKDGAGSGFIANFGGDNYLVTNAHVAAGVSAAEFKTLNGQAVPRGAAAVAVGHDIFRMALPPGGKPFEVMEGLSENAGIGDAVVVLGNAEGSGVINTIVGKIVGIGPNLLEVDAQFVPGNSGSPIVHLKTGKVIGVATYAVTRQYDATTKEKMKEPVIRRFGFRIDSVKTWQPVNWQTFYAQAAAMERIHTLTEALDNFFRDLFENKSRVTISQHTNPVIKTRISQWQDSKSRKLSVTDREVADANFISFLKIACQTDLADVQRSLTYDYFQRRLTEEQGTRNEMAKAFTEIIKNIRE